MSRNPPGPEGSVIREDAEVPVQNTLVLVRVFAALINLALLFDLLANCGELLLPMRHHIPWRVR